MYPMYLVDRLMLIAVALVDEPGAFQQRPQVVQRNPSVDLKECSFDDVLELRRIQRTRTIQCQ